MAFLEKLCSVTLTQIFLNLVGTIKIAYWFKDQLSAYLSIYLFIYLFIPLCMYAVNISSKNGQP